MSRDKEPNDLEILKSKMDTLINEARLTRETLAGILELLVAQGKGPDGPG